MIGWLYIIVPHCSKMLLKPVEIKLSEASNCENWCSNRLWKGTEGKKNKIIHEEVQDRKAITFSSLFPPAPAHVPDSELNSCFGEKLAPSQTPREKSVNLWSWVFTRNFPNRIATNRSNWERPSENWFNLRISLRTHFHFRCDEIAFNLIILRIAWNRNREIFLFPIILI